MKRTLLITLPLLLFILPSYSQFKIYSGGEIKFWNTNPGPWDNTFVTYANNDYSKCYVVRRATSDNFYVSGNGRTWSTGYHTLSDFRFKEDIEDVAGIRDLYDLQAKSYILNTGPTATTSVAEKDGSENTISDTESAKRREFGFIAQDVQVLYPEMVFEDENGFLSINYTEFIPLIIEALKQQRQEIDQLRSQVITDQETTKKSASYMPTASQKDHSFEPTLSQNIPNPFNENTIIRFHIPVLESHAMINVYDLQGNQIKSYDVNNTGTGEIMIPALDLHPGLFIYNLIVDGKEVASRRMVLTN